MSIFFKTRKSGWSIFILQTSGNPEAMVGISLKACKYEIVSKIIKGYLEAFMKYKKIIKKKNKINNKV